MTPTDGPARPRPLTVAILGYAAFVPAVIGFALHTSPPESGRPVLGKYSVGYALFLLGLAAVGALIPLPARALCRPTRIRRPDGGRLVIAGWRKVRLVLTAWVLAVAVAMIALEAALALPGAFRFDDASSRPFDWEVFRERLPGRCRGHGSRGWIGPDPTVEKPANTFRIFTLGGSTTYLCQNMDPQENFASRLQRSLQAARPAWTIEVINAAGDGNTSMHSLIKYAALLQDYPHDLITVMHAVNDWQQDEPPDETRAPGRGPFQRDYSHRIRWFLVAADHSGCGRPRDALWRRSVVLDGLLRGLDGTFLSDLRSRRRLSEARRRELTWGFAMRPLAPFRRNLGTIERIARRHGTTCLFLAQPTMYRPEAHDDLTFNPLTPEDAEHALLRDDPDVGLWAYTKAMRRFNDAGRAVAADRGALFADLERAVPADWSNFDEADQDPIHMNPHGCLLAARCLHDLILPLIPEQPPGSPPADAP